MTHKIRILLARHGQTEWNAQRRFQGKTDVPLNESGLNEARMLAVRLKNWPVDAIYTSPFSRALETAKIVSDLNVNAVRLEVRSELEEMSFGNWEKLSVHDVAKNFPGRYEAWKDDPSKVVPPGGESFEDVVKRVKPVLDDILNREDREVLIVAHGGVIRAIVVLLLGLSPSGIWHMRLDNCALVGLVLKDGKASLLFWNDTHHLHLPVNLIEKLFIP